MLSPTQSMWTTIAAVVTLVLFLSAVYSLYRQHHAKKSRENWPVAIGDILASDVILPPTHTSDDRADAKATIRYRYRVGSLTFENDAVNSRNSTPTVRAHAEALAARYPVGSQVDVHYDPHNPKDAMLEPARMDSLAAQYGYALVSGIAAFFLVLHAIAGKVIYAANGVPLFAFALPILALAAAVAGIATYLGSRRTARAAALWPTVEGTITKSAVIRETIESKGGDPDDETVRVKKRYRADIRYRYLVGERSYIGTNALGEWVPIYGQQEQAEKAVGAYPSGKRLVVHYDPAAPRTAVLDPGNRKGSTAPLVFSALCGGVGALLLAFFLLAGFET